METTNGRVSRTAIQIVAVAIGLGIFGDLMLRQTPWGLNAFLFVAAFAGSLVFLMVRHRQDLLARSDLALMGAMVFFGSMFVVRACEPLLVMDTLAIIACMGVLLLANFRVDQRVAGVAHYIGGVIWAGLTSVFGSFALLMSDIEWRSTPDSRLSRSIFSVLRGLAIALPLLLIFGALFMAADAAYEDFANRLVNFQVDEIVSHVLITTILAWLCAGYFRGTLVESLGRPPGERSGLGIFGEKNAARKDAAASPQSDAESAASLPNNATVLEHINAAASDPATAAAPPAASTSPTRGGSRDWQNFDNAIIPPVFTLGTVELSIILGLLNALFLSFVVFQIPYLFGGFDFVQSTPGLGLAEFARRGFGELVVVALLSLPVLLLTHWLLRRGSAARNDLYRVLAGVQIGLLFVIMVSAMHRLTLLTGELGYGWTRVRFFPMVVMIWLAVVFVWFSWTVLRGERQHFAWGAFWSAIIILAATNLMNPDDFIARKNIELMQNGRDYDRVYNAHELSADAVPALLEGMPSMTLENRCEVGSAIHYEYRQLGQLTDPRSLNLSRSIAFRDLRANDPMLHQTEGCPTQLHNDDAHVREDRERLDK